MRCFYNFTLNGFSNTYLLGPDEGGDAILIDPGELNIKLFKLIEDNDFYIKHILVTHNDSPHIGGIKTLLKIYNSDIYSKSPEILKIPTKLVSDGMSFELSGFNVFIIDAPSFSSDSVLYKIENMLFTGDVLGAGRVSKVIMEKMNDDIRESIKLRLLNLEDNTLIFPGHGPPSTIKVEKRFNPDIKDILEGVPLKVLQNPGYYS